MEDHKGKTGSMGGIYMSVGFGRESVPFGEVTVRKGGGRTTHINTLGQRVQ